mmetsp:Transcript_16195/g.2685  ORF Transcript_16195/g.2685 Transcript_16195/m.2685 type:complete len:97 (-) Transcript_16195:604-894(-)
MEQSDKNHYEPSDFNHFDMSHYCDHDYLIPFLNSLNNRNLVIYDFGCGIGGTTRLLAKHYASHVYGLDYLQGYLDLQYRINRACGIYNYTLFSGDA